jgi:Zn finger protein HypA/HybF involved in hydrogenase expression
MTLSWFYGPTAADPDPGKMWCRDCGGEVWVFDEVYSCRDCHREDLRRH